MSARSHTPSISDRFEETAIALILGLMALITFVNVVVRYVFNATWFSPVTEALGLPTNLLWSVELVSILFSWLVVLGISYCVKINAHLGVDAVVNFLRPGARRIAILFSCAACILYAIFLFKGGYDYWSNYVNLPQTTGRWFPTGFEEKFRGKAWYETNDVTMPNWLQFLATWFNDGEAYEKLPRLVPYTVLPFGFGLLLFRFIQATVQIYRGTRTSLIVSHEVEDAVEEAAAKVASQTGDRA